MGDVIDISLTSGSINEAIRALKAWEREIRKKAKSVCEQTANYAVGVASAYYEGYEGPPSDGDLGPPAVSKKEYSNGKGFHVIASGDPVYPEGNTVMFYEFGAGTAAGANNPIAGRVGAFPGSWSSTYGTGEFAKNKSWNYADEEWTAISGTNAMYQAGQDARNRMKELIQREFK